MTKNYICCAPYCWNHTSYDCHLWCTTVKWWNFLGFHYFFIIIRRVKVQKMAKMTKNCSLCLISQESCIIWSWFLVHMCRMMTSQDPFFNFSKFWFCRLLGGKIAKKAQPHTVSQEPYLIWLWFLVIYFFVK